MTTQATVTGDESSDALLTRAKAWVERVGVTAAAQQLGMSVNTLKRALRGEPISRMAKLAMSGALDDAPILAAARRLAIARRTHDVSKSDPERNVASGLELHDAQQSFERALDAWEGGR